MLKKVPWLKIFKSKACWSVFIGHFTHEWGNYMFMTQIPSYLRDVLKFDIKSVNQFKNINTQKNKFKFYTNNSINKEWSHSFNSIHCLYYFYAYI